MHKPFYVLIKILSNSRNQEYYDHVLVVQSCILTLVKLWPRSIISRHTHQSLIHVSSGHGLEQSHTATQ